MRTKAEFKVLRESLGMSQLVLAELCDVQTRTIKRWEHPGAEREPPDDAWRVLDDYKTKQDDGIAFTLDRVREIESPEGEPKKVVLSYWWSQEDYDEAHEDGGIYAMANANTRLVAHEIEHMETEIEVKIEYEGRTGL